MRHAQVEAKKALVKRPSIDPCTLTRTPIHDNSLLSSPVITRQFVSSSQASRADPADRSPSLEDVVLNLRNNSALSPQRRQNTVSACNAVARVLGRELTDLPVGPILLRRIANATPRAFGVKARRWNNVKSLCGKAIADFVPVTPRRRAAELTPEWRMLHGPIKGTPLQRSLSSISRFASERGIAPDDMGQSDFDEYHADLLGSLRSDPEKTYRLACLAWNNAVETIPGWPQFKVTRESRKGAWTLPWTYFPPSLVVEVTEWLHRPDRNGDVFEEIRWLLDEAPRLRSSTLEKREYLFRLTASALVNQGRDPQSIRHLVDLVTLEAFKLTLGYVIERRGGVGGQAEQLAKLLLSTARQMGTISDEEHVAMKGMLRRIRKKLDPGMTLRNRSRLRPFDDPKAVDLLLLLPGRLMDEAQRAKSRRKAAALAATAVAIELLLMAPMRIGNLSALDLERHFNRSIDGEIIAIALDGPCVKNNADLDYPLPETSRALIKTYVQMHRNCCETTALFPSRDGRGPRSHIAFGQQISRMVKIYTGLTINPHLFRHLGAHLYLQAHPGGYETVRLVLGHKDITTTTRFYTGPEMAAAVRHFQQTILNRRDMVAAR